MCDYAVNNFASYIDDYESLARSNLRRCNQVQFVEGYCPKSISGELLENAITDATKGYSIS